MSSVGAIRDQRKRVFPLVRRPLTTPNRLMAYAARLNGAKGAKARERLQQVRAKSGSVMETELAAIAFTAEVYGGLGIAEALINAPLPCRRRRAGLLVPIGLCSIFTGPRRISALNTMGVLPMRADQQDRDSRKRDGLMVDGIETATMTNSQFRM